MGGKVYSTDAGTATTSRAKPLLAWTVGSCTAAVETSEAPGSRRRSRISAASSQDRKPPNPGRCELAENEAAVSGERLEGREEFPDDRPDSEDPRGPRA